MLPGTHVRTHPRLCRNPNPNPNPNTCLRAPHVPQRPSPSSCASTRAGSSAQPPSRERPPRRYLCARVSGAGRRRVAVCVPYTYTDHRVYTRGTSIYGTHASLARLYNNITVHTDTKSRVARARVRGAWPYSVSLPRLAGMGRWSWSQVGARALARRAASRARPYLRIRDTVTCSVLESHT